MLVRKVEYTVEWLLANQEFELFKVVGCEVCGENEYKLLCKCKVCGDVSERHLRWDKPCIMRCKNCNKNEYLIPFGEDKEESIGSFRVIPERVYRKIRKQYKENGVNMRFMTYLRLKILRINI